MLLLMYFRHHQRQVVMLMMQEKLAVLTDVDVSERQMKMMPAAR